MGPMQRPSTVDPVRDGLVEELRALRRGQGPWPLRLGPMTWTTDIAGQGSVERAVRVLEDLRADLGTDTESDIGAFFWLADQGITDPELSLEQRLDAYADTFLCHPRTALRRSDKGIAALAGAIRDRAEADRPVGMIWLFQSGTTATVVLDFVMAYQSFRYPVITVNGDVIDGSDFVLHHEVDNDKDRYRARIILDNLPIAIDLDPYATCLQVRAIWQMPIWPVWQLTGWVVDPHFLVRLQTFSERAAEVRLLWRAGTVPAAVPTLHASA